MSNDLTYWNDALAGRMPPIHADQPHAGYYRMRQHKDGPFLPVCIYVKDAALVALIGAAKTYRPATEVWTYCADRPVTKEAAMHAFANGNVWPDMPVPTPLSNMPNDPFDALLAEIADKQEQAEALLAKGDAKSELDSNLARNLQAELLALHKRADAMFKAEKDPITEAGRVVDEKFRFRVTLKSFADKLRGVWERFLKAEEDRLRKELAAKRKADEERIAAENAKLAAERAALMESDPALALASDPPAPVELPPVEPVKVNAGGGFGRKGGLKTEWVPRIDDYRAALAHFAEHADVRAAVEKLVKAATRAGKETTKIPGVTIIEDRRAA